MHRRGFILLQMAMNMNVTNLVQEGGYIPYIHRPETYIVPGLFLIILIVGVFGNGLMMITLGTDSAARNTSTIYMFSLALGDILVRKYNMCIYYL